MSSHSWKVLLFTTAGTGDSLRVHQPYRCIAMHHIELVSWCTRMQR